MTITSTTLGAIYSRKNEQTRFCVWAPRAKTVEVRVISPCRKYFNLHAEGAGYYTGITQGIAPGAHYFYRLDKDKERPDPAARFQPRGVHGPSAVMDDWHEWTDSAWKGLSLRDYIFYELHVGTFTREGTFEAIIPHLDELADLGITAVELMPVAQFPGNRNWGYDGVYPFAVQNSYGGPVGLKRLVNACHNKGLAVVLDVVYNHLGPEGNYLRDFGFYFTDHYRTPWGDSINFDGPYSDEVRRFFMENAVYWFTQFHVDALRLDAVHAIFDFSAVPFLQELAETVHALGETLNRKIYLIPESASNDNKLLRPSESGGYSLDAQWNDDFHHALHTVLTGERTGYYQDFGSLDQVVKSLTHGFIYDGIYSPFRKRRHGNSSRLIPLDKFVVYSQNHDQVGNRMKGERLAELISGNALKLAAAMVLLSPCLPLLFMGEEYGETAPFPYFVSHSDPELIQAVREGRRREFESFNWKESPPDPQAPATFNSAILRRKQCLKSGKNQVLMDFYRQLIRIRKELSIPAGTDKETVKVDYLVSQSVIRVSWESCDKEVSMLFHFSDSPVTLVFPMSRGIWQKKLDSNMRRAEDGSCTITDRVESNGKVQLDLDAYGCLVFVKEKEQ